MRRWRGGRRFQGRYIPPEVVIIEGDYLDRKSRMDYLRQKLAAEGRMAMFDELPDEVRAVATGAPSFTVAWQLHGLGCRTFDQAELAIAGVWDGR